MPGTLGAVTPQAWTLRWLLLSDRSATRNSMYTGHIDSANHYCLTGWAADTDRPAARLQLRIMVNGQEQGVVTADQPREGLRQRGTYGDGAHAFTYLFDPPLLPLHGYDIVVRFIDMPSDVPNGRLRL